MRRGIDEHDLLANPGNHWPQWIFERVGWILIVLVLAAGASGVLGSGPLAHTVAGSAQSGFWARYDRFQRRQSPNEIEVHVAPGLVHDGRIRLDVSRGWMEAVDLESVDPAPAAVVAGEDHVTFEFRAAPSAHETVLVLRFRPDEYLANPAELRIDGAPELQLPQFVYP